MIKKISLLFIRFYYKATWQNSQDGALTMQDFLHGGMDTAGCGKYVLAIPC
jgi:hypothetical protein